jgi:uncharacterized protein (DUF1330 family)
VKTGFTVAFSMLAGVAVGAVAVQGLHAQGKPPVYLVTEIDVTNPEGYGKEFAPKAQASIKAAGGRQIAIGGAAGAGAKAINPIEGTAPKRAVIQQWDSMEALMAWYNGAEYKAAIEIGKKYASFRRYAIEGNQ